MTLTAAARTDGAAAARSHGSGAQPDTAPESVVDWVASIAKLTTPSAIHWCDGSPQEYDRLTREMIETGTLTRLNSEHRPYSFLARSDPKDVARV